MMPKSGGTYRLYCFLSDTHGGAATDRLPIKDGSQAPVKPMIAIMASVAGTWEAMTRSGDEMEKSRRG